MRRFITLLAVVSLGVALGSGSAGAFTVTTYAVNGSYTGTVEFHQNVPGCSAGGLELALTGSGTIAPFGVSSFALTFCGAPGHDQFALTATDGTVTGPVTHLTLSVIRELFTAHFEVAITGGTGRYAHASGNLTSDLSSFNGAPTEGSMSGTVAFGAPTPTAKAECMNGGWRNLSDNTGVPFKNQGTCIAFALHNPFADWPMFGFDSQHTGFNPSEHTISTANVSTLTTRWTATAGNSVRSSPAVANGIVYATAEDGRLYAFDANSGVPRWNRSLGNVISWSSPAVANGAVFAGGGDGALHAFDAASGAPLWTGPTGGFVGSSPTVAGGIVYVTSFDNKLYAFDATGADPHCTGVAPNRTCSPLWTASIGSGPLEVDSPAVADGVVYVGASDDKLRAFDAQTGALLWTAVGGSGTPAIAYGRVYIGDSLGLLVYDAAGKEQCGGIPKVCSPLWVAAKGGAFESAPAVANGVVYTGGGGTDGNEVQAYDAFGKQNCSGDSAPLICTPLWRATPGGFIEASPTLANGVLYIGSDDFHLYAFDAAGKLGCDAAVPTRTCAPLFTAATGSTVAGAAAVTNGTVYVGSFDAKVYAFAPTG
jgi:outer membrane protein assembly factor BamB